MKHMNRALWPSPQENPIVALVLGDREWISNREVADAIGLGNAKGNVSVQAHFPGLIEDLTGDTRLMPTPGEPWQKPRQFRAFNKRAIIHIAMRARTANSAAFRDWIAHRILEDGAI